MLQSKKMCNAVDLISSTWFQCKVVTVCWVLFTAKEEECSLSYLGEAQKQKTRGYRVGPQTQNSEEQM